MTDTAQGVDFRDHDGRPLTYEEAGPVLARLLAKSLGIEAHRVFVSIHDVSESEDSTYASTFYHIEIDGRSMVSSTMNDGITAFLQQFHSSVQDAVES